MATPVQPPVAHSDDMTEEEANAFAASDSRILGCKIEQLPPPIDSLIIFIALPVFEAFADALTAEQIHNGRLLSRVSAFIRKAAAEKTIVSIAEERAPSSSESSSSLGDLWEVWAQVE